MEWKNPELLFWILPLCVSWLFLAVYSDRRRNAAREAFVAKAMWERILPEASRFRFWIKNLLRTTAIIFGLMALAGPQYGTQYEQVIPRGSDLYVLIDVSKSMLAEDVAPSRLGRAKADVSSLVNRLDGERIGLIAFAGQAVVKCPLTVDYDSFRRSLQELDPNSAPRGGTAIGDAIRKALEVFKAKEERDQAILLITDGDDQESYPLEAASIAAERQVTIFTVGLGDSNQGSRIPQKADSRGFVEYQGEQVWSKLDGILLSEIALKTSGIYIPAGTRTYDLGELYSSHLQGRQSSESATQQRVRKSEQFQFFLAVALLSLIVDLCITPFRRSQDSSGSPVSSSNSVSKGQSSPSISPQVKMDPMITSMAIGFLILLTCNNGTAEEPDRFVREGIKLYAEEKFDAAREKFASAYDALDKRKSAASAIASFDEACAHQRQGEIDKASECYLRAGSSSDRSVGTAAYFNLGTMSADEARKKAGEQPELVEPDKRQEILDQLMRATVAYRHCLEIQPDHSASRRNLEMVRLWIKYYSDKWSERDRQKRRDETNLLQFLEYLQQSQTALKETVQNSKSNATADAFAELKQSQDELIEEIPTLRDKIEKELQPEPSQNAAPSSAVEAKQLEEGIKLLQGWAETAGRRMSASSRYLGSRDAGESVREQQVALDEFDKIWDAIIPFHPLLAKELAEQTSLAETLTAEKPAPSTSEATPLEIADDEVEQIIAKQEKTLKKSRLLAPKAEMELKQLESQPTPVNDTNTSSNLDPNQPESKPQVDPEQVKLGYQKGVELAPAAVEQMEGAVKSLKKKELQEAARFAEEARRILQEIQDAQPKNPDQQNKDQQQQDKQEDSNKEDPKKKENSEEKKPDEKKGDENKSDEKKSDEKKPDDKKGDEPKKDEKGSPGEKKSVSDDRIEEVMRKVRERLQEKRDRDQKMKVQGLGKSPVDKDW